jgi:hypothetical protein
MSVCPTVSGRGRLGVAAEEPIEHDRPDQRLEDHQLDNDINRWHPTQQPIAA